MMPKLENLDPPASANIAPNYRSGSFAPVPNGPFYDPRQGGEVRPANVLPIKNGGQD
jgi:hypothetical protein